MMDSEGCIDYINGGVLDENSRRYDEILNPLVEEENQIRHEDFNKLNLPPEELLKTETSRDAFPERNKPVNKSIKIDKEVLKSTGTGIMSKARSMFDKMVEIRNQQQQQRKLAKETEKSTPHDTGHETEVTHLREVLKREPQLKTIEEMKKPELASYPIMAPKTAESIQEDEEEDVEEDIKEIKKIVEPDVAVPKDLPQSQKDPFLPPSTVPSQGKGDHSKKPSWIRRQGSNAWKATKNTSKRFWTFMKESDVAGQVLLFGVSAGGERVCCLTCSCATANSQT